MIHAFFIRTSNLQLIFSGDFILKLFLKLNCSYFLIFPNSGLVVRNNKKALMFFFHSAVCYKTLKYLTCMQHMGAFKFMLSFSDAFKKNENNS